MSWWDSIDTVSRFNNWMQFAVIIFAFLAGISGFLVWFSGNRIALQQTKLTALAQQKTKTYEKTSLSVHKELVALQQGIDYAPEIQRVSRPNIIAVCSSSSETYSPRKLVHKSSYSPEESSIIPSRFTTNSP